MTLANSSGRFQIGDPVQVKSDFGSLRNMGIPEPYCREVLKKPRGKIEMGSGPSWKIRFPWDNSGGWWISDHAIKPIVRAPTTSTPEEKWWDSL